MSDELSVSYTFAIKYGLPPVGAVFALTFVLAMLLAPDQMFRSGDAQLPVWGQWIVALIPVVLVLWILQFVRPLVRVECDEETLSVWTARSRVTVPVSEVETVRRRPASGGTLVDIIFRRPSALGKSVSFLPNAQDVVERLQELTRRVR